MSLLQLVKQVSSNALKGGTLKPLDTTVEYIIDEGRRFSLKSIKKGTMLKPSNLETQVQQKQQEQVEQKENILKPRLVFDCFKPVDETMIVKQYGSHTLVLNKFPVLPYHVLLITSNFSPQTDHLSQSDLEKSLQVMEELKSDENAPDWMIFYNRGLFSGASQPHKHIQMVPLTNENGEENFVLCESLDKQALQGSEKVEEYAGIKHGFCSLGTLFGTVSDLQQRAKLLYEKYISLLKSLDLWEGKKDNDESQIIQVVCEPDMEAYMKKKNNGEQIEIHSMSFSLEQHPSYNLLFTTKWMLIVPRRLENYEGISVNSLGFMFGLFVKTAQDKHKLVKEIGLMNFIRHITIPE